MAKRRGGKSEKEKGDDPSSRREVRLIVYRAEARKVLGAIAERTFAKLEADGVIVAARRGRGGRKSSYDLEIIVPAYLNYLTGQRPAPDRDARSRRDVSQAELNELKLARERGELLSRDQAILEGQHFSKAWAAKVRALPRQLVQIGIVARDQEAGVAAICRELLDEIAGWRTVADTEKVMKAS